MARNRSSATRKRPSSVGSTRPNRDGALDQLGREGGDGEALGELDGRQDDRRSTAEELVELVLHADQVDEVVPVLPGIEQLADAGEREPLVLEAADEPQSGEVRIAVPAGATFQAGRGQQASLAVEPHGGRGHPGGGGQVVEAHLVGGGISHGGRAYLICASD